MGGRGAANANRAQHESTTHNINNPQQQQQQQQQNDDDVDHSAANSWDLLTVKPSPSLAKSQRRVVASLCALSTASDTSACQTCARGIEPANKFAVGPSSSFPPLYLKVLVLVYFVLYELERPPIPTRDSFRKFGVVKLRETSYHYRSVE